MMLQVPPYALYYDDEQEIREKYWTPQAGEWVIDVGARYGSYTLPALAAGAGAIAVDPHAEILGLLHRAAVLNGFENQLITVCAALLDDQPYPEGLTEQIGERWPAGSPGDDAQFSTLDEIADARVDWIKIDVEGVELQVLKGGLETLKRYRPKLLIEDHTRVYPWCEDNQIRYWVCDLLRNIGYGVQVVPYEPGARGGAPRDFIVAT